MPPWRFISRKHNTIVHYEDKKDRSNDRINFRQRRGLHGKIRMFFFFLFEISLLEGGFTLHLYFFGERCTFDTWLSETWKTNSWKKKKINSDCSFHVSLKTRRRNAKLVFMFRWIILGLIPQHFAPKRR